MAATIADANMNNDDKAKTVDELLDRLEFNSVPFAKTDAIGKKVAELQVNADDGRK